MRKKVHDSCLEYQYTLAVTKLGHSTIVKFGLQHRKGLRAVPTAWISRG